MSDNKSPIDLHWITWFSVKKENWKTVFELSNKDSIVLDVSTFTVSADFVDGLNWQTKTNYSRFIWEEVDLFQINTWKKDFFKIWPVLKWTLDLEKFDKGKLIVTFIPE